MPERRSPQSGSARTCAPPAATAAADLEMLDLADGPFRLTDAHILFLEDNALILLDAEEMLLGLGAARVYAVHTLAAAEAVAERECIDAAILDVLIGDRTSDAFARRLHDRGVPLVLVSGCDDGAILPDLRHLPKVLKPYTPATLMAALEAIGLGPEPATPRADLAS